MLNRLDHNIYSSDRLPVFSHFSFPICLWLTIGLLLPILHTANPAIGAEVSILAIEVTQGLQAITESDPLDPKKNNTVPLVKGRKSLIRVYVSRGGFLIGSIYVAPNSGGPGIILTSNNFGPIAGGLYRDDINASLNFQLPNPLTEVEGITIRPVWIWSTFVSRAHPPTTCNNCGSFPSLTLSFIEDHPLRTRIIGIDYTTTSLHEVGELHYKMLRSWLKRTLPIHEVVSPFPATSTEQDGVPYDTTIGSFFDYGNKMATCVRVNQQLFNIRRLDLDTNESDFRKWLEIYRTRYIGLYLDEGFPYIDGRLFFPPGCPSSSPVSSSEVVSSAPVGVGRAEIYPWDDDGSYGDWSASHELGHTFGKGHPGLPSDCGAPQPDGTLYGTVSPNYRNDPIYAGVDFGDWIQLENGSYKWLPMKTIPGNWYDAMSYCPNHATNSPPRKWINWDTYNGIRTVLEYSDFPILELFFPSPLPVFVFMANNPRPPSIAPDKELPKEFVECFRNLLDDPKVVFECLQKGGRGRFSLRWGNLEKPSSSSSSTTPTSPDTFEGSPQPSMPDPKIQMNTPRLSIEIGRFLSVTASVDLSSGEGTLIYARQITLAPKPSQSPDKRVTLRVSYATGQTVTFPMVLFLDSDHSYKKYATGIATVILPFESPITKIELLIAGAHLPVDSIIVSDQPLPSVEIAPLEGAHEGENRFFSLTWSLNLNTPPGKGSKITYNVQVSYDKGDSWQTIAVNLRDSGFKVPKYRITGFEHFIVKVIASDRFRTSESCSDGQRAVNCHREG